MAENVLGRIILDAGNKARGITGGGAPPISGLLEGDAPSGGGGGGSADSTKEASGRRFQKGIEAFNKKSLEFAKAQPRWFTSLFKKVGIQMGLAGILKQSQIFTSTIGSLFQIFGAFIDVMLAPLIRPLILPILRWLARRIPDVSRFFKAFWHGWGVILKGIGRGFKTLFSKDFWTQTVFGGLISFFTDTLPDKFFKAFDLGKNLFSWVKDGLLGLMRSLWNNSMGGKRISIPFLDWGYTFPTWGGTGSNQVLEKKNKAGVKWNEVTNEKGELIEVQMKDEKGNVLSYEDPRTGLIESPYVEPKPGSKMYEFYQQTGATYKKSEGVKQPGVEVDPLTQRPTNNNGDDPPLLSVAGVVNKFKELTDPENWSAVFGDFQTKFAEFWDTKDIKDVLIAAGGTVAASAVVKAAGVGVSAFTKTMGAITWPARMLFNLTKAAAKTPTMMGWNTLKWSVKQLNVLGKGGEDNVIRTLFKEGIPEGSKTLIKRAIDTLGSGAGNAMKNIWDEAVMPVKNVARGANIVWRNTLGKGNVADDAARAAMNSFDEVADLVPRKSPRVFDPSIKKSTPTGPTRPVYTGPDTVSKTNRITAAMKKFTDFGDAIKAFVRGARGWTLETIKTKASRLATLGDQALSMAKGADMVDIVSKIRMLKSFAGRLVPFAATGIAIATTGKNVADIANMEHLSWWMPHAGMLEDKFAPLFAQLETHQEKFDAIEGNSPLAWGRRLMQSMEGNTTREQMGYEALNAMIMGTKGGAIATQGVMGIADALLGFGGAITLPMQAGIMGAQFAHMQGVKGYNEEAGTWTGTLDELMTETGLNMDAATLQLAIEQGMSNALKNSTINGKIELNGSSFVEFQ